MPKNMPGAGGVALGNHLFGVAPPDGLTLGVPRRTAFLLAPVTGNANARYDLIPPDVIAEFRWYNQ